MKRIQQFTAIIEREGNGYVSLCPEVDIASQGDTVEQAKNNLIEALGLFFETASASEVFLRRDTALPCPYNIGASGGSGGRSR